MTTKLVLAVLLLNLLSHAQLPTQVPFGGIVLGATDPNTGQTYISVSFNSLSISSAHVEDVILDVSGTQVHTGPIDNGATIDLFCSADPNALCPAPPYRYIAAQVQFNPLPSTHGGTIRLATGELMSVYGIETAILAPRLGDQYLHLQTTKPNTKGQALTIMLRKCPNDLIVGCQ